jgi:MarR-like DNA-binding transcriptional regulator SgrR of sgrS sRNA
MTHDEIAQILGCSRRNVGHLLAKFTEQAKSGEKVA